MRPLLFTVWLTAGFVSAAVKIEKIAWQGWPNCYRVSNGEVELIVTTDVGPRVMRYAFAGGRNLFKEYADQLGKTGEKEFQLRGGHRLWVAPEDLKTTWALDNGPVKARIDGDALELTQPVDSAGIEKRIVIRLAPTGSAVELVHQVRNARSAALDLAPWTLTVMAPGGVAITGFPPRGKHPEALLPTHPLVMWAYTNLADRRWQFTPKYLVLRQEAKASEPQKIGLFNPNTWGAYLLGTDLFVKKTQADPRKTYPDFGCSYETFTNAEMLELETLGPLERVPAGRAVEHRERWSLHKNARVGAWSEPEIDRVIGPHVAR